MSRWVLSFVSLRDGVPPYRVGSKKQLQREMHRSVKANGQVSLPHFPVSAPARWGAGSRGGGARCVRLRGGGGGVCWGRSLGGLLGGSWDGPRECTCAAGVGSAGGGASLGEVC